MAGHFVAFRAAVFLKRTGRMEGQASRSVRATRLSLSRD